MDTRSAVWVPLFDALSALYAVSELMQPSPDFQGGAAPGSGVPVDAGASAHGSWPTASGQLSSNACTVAVTAAVISASGDTEAARLTLPPWNAAVA